MITLGLDIGSNSVGSAWIDTERKLVRLGASVFPAGVDETDAKRGTPVNQKRRQVRSLRRSLARRSARKRRLRCLLTDAGLLPRDSAELKPLFDSNPWVLRRDALARELPPHEFGRVLVHLNQRRGALGVETDPDNADEGKVKEAIDNLKSKLAGRTIGQFMADEMDARRIPIQGAEATHCQAAVRNRRDSFEFHADRTLVREEFERVWAKQKGGGGPLAGLLTDDLRRKLDDPAEDDTWRSKGVIFGQRRTYWDTGTLGRCDLEPTDHRCPVHDMHAQAFRVIETVNNIRLGQGGDPKQPLTPEDREKVIAALRKQKSGSVATVRKALGIDKRTLKRRDLPEDLYRLNLDEDQEREINTDHFYREIVHGVFGEERWANMTDGQRGSVNRALLKFDQDAEGHADRLRAGASKWWGLGEQAVEKLLAEWKGCGRTSKRLNISQRAIRNLMPYMDRYDEEKRHWPTQIEARQMFAEDPDNHATPEQRVRYAHTATDRLREVLLRHVRGDEGEFKRLLRLRGSTKADRHYLLKHPGLLPPAPTLANPVVRKAIHEVRRHVLAYLHEFGRNPDRVVIELARQARQSERVRNATLARNRNREKIRKQITDDFDLAALTPNQQRTALNRVILCRQQRGACAYTGERITDRQAALGVGKGDRGLEIDHVVPYSRCGDNSLNNRVLCYVEPNRGKHNQTPKEWWGDAFDERIRPLAFMQSCRPAKGDPNEYFTARDYARKWDNLTREVRPEDEWKNSQLTDTAYAATQVMAYLRDALFEGKQERDRGVFETNGRYTALLRRDWGLVGEQGKSRDDHRHHAIDALVIALTHPRDLLPKLARTEAEREEYHDRTGYWPRRTPAPPPWPQLPDDAGEEEQKRAVEEFRRPIVDAVDRLVVCHRPVKRRITGAFHEETLFGPVLGNEDNFTNRIDVVDLTPNHLREPRPETESEAVLRLAARYQRMGLSNKNARRRARQAVKSPGYAPKIVDPPPGKTGIVRDRDLRRRLRACINDGLQALGVPRDADSFTKDDIKKLSEAGSLRMPSDVPIKSVILLRTMKDPVVIPRKVWDPTARCMVLDPDPRTRRVYVGGNNHHIEIREDSKGKWTGLVVPTFDVARRVRIENKPAVDRSPNTDGRFVLSLAEGETVHMRHPKTAEPGYFVVFKLDKPHTIHLKHHWDARKAGGTKGTDGTVLPGTRREDVAVTSSELRSLAPPSENAPYKVTVDPLGRIRRAND